MAGRQRVVRKDGGGRVLILMSQMKVGGGGPFLLSLKAPFMVAGDWSLSPSELEEERMGRLC